MSKISKIPTSPLAELSWGALHPEDYAEELVEGREATVDAALSALEVPLATGDTLSHGSLWEAGLSTFTGVTHWVPVAERVWRAWTGPRRRDGEAHHGPVWHIDTDVPYDGPRDCACGVCSASTAGHPRHN